MDRSLTDKIRRSMNRIVKRDLNKMALFLTVTALISGGIFLLIIEPIGLVVRLFLIGQVLTLGIIAIALIRNKDKPAKSDSNVESTANDLETDHHRLDSALRATDWPFEKSQNLTPERVQSILRNSNRLFAVEKELSSLFRPRNVGDNYAKMLVCQLKICASRLKSDLSEMISEK